MRAGRVLLDRRALIQRRAEARAKAKVARSSHAVGLELDRLEAVPDLDWDETHEERRNALLREYSAAFQREEREERERLAGDDEGEPP